jgi:hypothetical protein
VSIRFLHGRAEDLVPTLPPSLVLIDPPWGRDWPKDRCTLADLPVLAAILPQCRGEVWAKVPPSFDPSTVPGAVPSAWFGTEEGDRRRVKFLLLRIAGPDAKV